MKHSDFVAKVAEETGESKAKVARILTAATSLLTGTVAGGESVVVSGLGTFTLKRRAARPGKNPRTGEALEIPERNVPAFKAERSFRFAANVDVSAQ